MGPAVSGMPRKSSRRTKLAKAALGVATIASAFNGVQAQGGTPHLPEYKVSTAASVINGNFGITKHKVCPCVDDPIPKNHCEDIQVDLSDAHAQEWWSANEYAYTQYTDGLCDSSLYSTVNHKTTPPSACGVGVHEGECHVILRRLGKSGLADTEPVEALYDEYCLHQEDTEDHKCFEACSAAGTFKTKGIKGTGKCPAKYTTLDKTVDVQQCSDGVTSIRYCKPIKVTIATKGEAGGLDTLLALMKTADVMRHQIKGNHCGDLFVEFEKDSTLDRVNDWWSANSYKYESYEKGLCPTVQFRTVDHLEHPIGVKGVTMRDMGMNAIAMAAPVVGLVHMI